MMKITYTDDGVLISQTKDFDVKKSCECGQCFRFDPYGKGYRGVIGRQIVDLEPRDDGCFFPNMGKNLFESLIIPYFDLERDYDEIVSLLSDGDEVLKSACEYGRGLRLFKQDTWEALISFIISQNNNIPRIKGIITRLCQLAGDEIAGGIYAFPTPEQLGRFSAEDLTPIRAGFRNRYIADACRKVLSGEVNLKALETMPYDKAKAELMKICGVGTKVADCVLLFGAGHIEAFPVDVWIKRALAALYPNRTDTDFGPYGGIAQQYLFVYARENKIN